MVRKRGKIDSRYLVMIMGGIAKWVFIYNKISFHFQGMIVPCVKARAVVVVVVVVALVAEILVSFVIVQDHPWFLDWLASLDQFAGLRTHFVGKDWYLFVEERLEIREVY